VIRDGARWRRETGSAARPISAGWWVPLARAQSAAAARVLEWELVQASGVGLRRLQPPRETAAGAVSISRF